MLQTTKASVLQVGLAVGYEPEAAFVRAFKREFGLPPARYRKSLSQSASQNLFSQETAAAPMEQRCKNRSRQFGHRGGGTRSSHQH